MLSELLQKMGIRAFAQVPAEICRPANPRLYGQIPEGCRVVFMLIPYAVLSALEGSGISAYGAVFDYHGFAKKLFFDTEEYLKGAYPDAYVKGFADHSPFGECDGASRAGLGVIGDHSLLISEEYSSFVFIAELVTDISAEALLAEGIPESPRSTPMYCEHCGACQRACPSGCVGKADRDRCVSAVTQKKGELSDAETDLIKRGGSIWGCDICQLACPHTKKAIREGTVATPIEYFKSSFLGADPVAAVEAMDPETFALYPFAWRKRPTIQRNIDIIKGK